MNTLESSRVMFVLGAGASVPLGMPTTVSLMQRLEGETRLGRLAAEVHQSAAYRFRVPAASINIEDFFEQLYEIQLLLWLASRSELPTLLPGFTSNARVLDHAGRDVAALQQRAYRLLHRLCGDCSGARVNKLWQPILEFVATRQPFVPLFTLNYDWTFEKLAIENAGRYHLTDGFELPGGTWNGERFDRLRPSRSKINLVLFKLHGSTCWLPGGPVKSMGRFEVRIPNDSWDGEPLQQFEMVYPGHAHEMSLGKEFWDRATDPHGTQWPWLEREPYKTLFRYFHNAARHAKLIVVIGYAFHDKVVNQEILRASRHAKIIVLDPGGPGLSRSGETGPQPPFNSIEMMDRDTPWSKFLWIGGKFGGKFDETPMTQVLLEKIEELLASPSRKGKK